MAELKLPFHFTVGKDFPADQVEVNFETLRKLVQDLDEKVEAFNDLVVSGTFENTGKLTTTTGAVVTLPGTLVNTDKLETDSSGNVRQVSQPSFLASITYLSPGLRSSSGDDPIDFGTEIYDQNGDFSTSTDTFTAPITGRYAFMWIMLAENEGTPADSVNFLIETSNRNYSINHQPFATGTTGDKQSVTLTAIADLDANDTAHCSFTAFAGGSPQTISIHSQTFSGSLIN